ncbi:MAG: putative RNA methyltransferase, partial [Bacilli bacterium]
MQCPLCSSSLKIDDKSLVCLNNHTFNINKKGFVHMALNKSI